MTRINVTGPLLGKEDLQDIAEAMKKTARQRTAAKQKRWKMSHWTQTAIAAVLLCVGTTGAALGVHNTSQIAMAISGAALAVAAIFLRGLK